MPVSQERAVKFKEPDRGRGRPVIVAVVGPVIVAVHVNGNATVGVIESVEDR
jgi:hypothetical protein